MTTVRATLAGVTALCLVLSLAACGSKAPSAQKQADEVAAALQALATDPVALVSSQASDEAREMVAELFVPGSKVSPDVKSWAPDGPNKGTMVVTVEPPDQDPRTITIVVVIEDSEWKISDILEREPPASPSDSPETGLTLNPFVFELIGQPPDQVEQLAGEFQRDNTYYDDEGFFEGFWFAFGDYRFRFSGSTEGFAETTRASNVYPVGVSNSVQCRLDQIIDGLAGLVTVSDLDGLFGQVGIGIEPEQPGSGFWYGGVEYFHETFSIAFAYSEASGGGSLITSDLVLVRIVE